MLATLFTLFLVPSLHAAPIDHEKINPVSDGNMVICEKRLSEKAAEEKAKLLDYEFLGRPFLVQTVHEITNEGMRKLGIEPTSTERALKDIVLVAERSRDHQTLIVSLLRYANSGFKTIQRFEFIKPELVGYRSLTVTDEHWDKSYLELLLTYPERVDRPSRDKLWVGYQTEPDADGVRRYIEFTQHGRSVSNDISMSITLGLDVPPGYHQAAQYSPDLAEVTDDLRSPTGVWRRIGALVFARVD